MVIEMSDSNLVIRVDCEKSSLGGGKVVRIFQALASEARITIVRELSDGSERCVCDLVESCGLGWSTVSHHLSCLREAGIVEDEKRGKQVFYRLILPCVSGFIRCLEETCNTQSQGK